MSADGLHLRTRWMGREFIPFDEVRELGERGITLASGRFLRLPPEARTQVEQALVPPRPQEDRAAEAQAFARYLGGAWSPTRAARALLDLAAARGATDIHLEAGCEALGIRYRLAGEVVDVGSVPAREGARLIAAFKHLSGCLPYRTDMVQEGRIPRDGVAADVRASFLPTALGERAALRLFGRLLDLADLGFEPSILATWSTLLGRPSGLLLVAGSSGAGKTTTLYASLAALVRQRGGAHLSLEDPVEQRLRMAGIPVDQVELQPERGLTAEVALVGALRQDVDVLAVGEIRTAPEAALALRAAHTGRMVLAGVHAGSPQEARQRLLDLGVDPGVLDQTLLGVLHQGLVTVPCGCQGPCPRCRGLGRIRRPRAQILSLGGVP